MSTLYRKYRPSKFSEIVGQTHIVRTLSNAIKNNRAGHAYLFTGPRGTGKTTMARVFAKTLNCLEPNVNSDPPSSEERLATPFAKGVEPCNKCANCKLIMENKAIDLIEIDAASNTGVDNIRQLKETVHLPPTALKYKIYIIDEVHMLSTGAFNALLKTLEEPPAHVIFILATTELHKVPETIISRCQRFDFSRFTLEQITTRLKQICREEGVEIEEEAVFTIALEAEGGMRDAESLLAQIISIEDKNITAEEVSQVLGTSSKKVAINFVKMIADNKIQEALEEIDKLQSDGVNLKNFNKNILSYLRSLLLLKANSENSSKNAFQLTQDQIETSKSLVSKLDLPALLKLLELFQNSLSTFKNTTIPQLPLEMAVVQWHLENGSESGGSSPQSHSTVSHTPAPKPASTTSNTPPSPPTAVEFPPQIETSNIPFEPSLPSAPVVTDEPIDADPAVQCNPGGSVELEDLCDKWSEFLKELKPHNHSLFAFLQNCTPMGIIEDKLYIKTKYDFYRDKLSEVGNKLTVSKVIGKITGVNLSPVYVTEKEASSIDFGQSEAKGKPRSILHDAMQMLGGKIVKG